MESDHQPTSDQKTIDRDEQGASVVTTLARSYECNFCKRGFSNAQALGGHMNIHRKDKAKLKQQSSNQTHQPSSLDIHHEVAMVPSDEERSNPTQQHQVSSKDETLRQLPLFEESPTSSENQNLQGQIHHGAIITQRDLSSGQGSSLELDLELRLGPEPGSSSAATSTRKFF